MLDIPTFDLEYIAFTFRLKVKNSRDRIVIAIANLCKGNHNVNPSHCSIGLSFKPLFHQAFELLCVGYVAQQFFPSEPLGKGVRWTCNSTHNGN